MSRPRLKRALTPLQRHQHSRAAQRRRVERAVGAGVPLAVLATLPGMPKRMMLEHWRDDDERMRARHIAALERQRMLLAEEFVAEADRAAEHARGRRRIIVLRGQIAARTRLLRLIAAVEKTARTAHGRVAPRPSETEWRGLSEEDIAVLERAAARFTTPISPEPEAEEDELASVDAPPTNSSSRHPRAPLFEGPCASGPMGGDPEPPTEEAKTETRDSQPDGRVAPRPFLKEGRGNDEEENDAPSYAPEDARYCAKQRDKESQAPKPPKPPSVEERKSPWKPDTPTTVRFDVGGGFDVSNQRDETISDYDPFR
ncbi:MAG TPA: hypothetical protein VL966_13780 [Alphaproteobacteria bacterium]|jgi:hypothetical protein|nr:hypothetical protein [Alphaproteobacteria bacterium]